MNVAPRSVSLAQTNDRARLLEEQQIARMIAEIGFRRDEASLLKSENNKLNDLVSNLNKQIDKLNQLVNEYKSASADRQKELELKDKIDKLYKESVADYQKQVAKLQRTVSFWRKVAGVGLVVAFGAGYALAH